MTETEFERFVHECREELARKQEQIAEILLFDVNMRFDERRVEYSADGTVVIDGAIVLVGSRGLSSSTWIWAWANQGAGDAPLEHRLRELEAVTGHAEFAAARALPADEQQAWNYAAIACHHLNGVGVGRLSDEHSRSDWFFVLHDLRRHRPEEEIAARAETAVHEALRAARGPVLLNMMRKRFPALRLNLIDADLRGAPNPWAHDLHVQRLVELDDLQAKAVRQVYPGDRVASGRFASHRPHDLSGANLAGARLDGAILRGVTLQGASLEGASLVDADLLRIPAKMTGVSGGR